MGDAVPVGVGPDEDLGRIPTVADWLGRIQPEPWMLGRDRKTDVPGA